jgi:hypothetical protein
MLEKSSGMVVDVYSSVLRIETKLETPTDVVLRLTGKISEEHLVMLEGLLDEALECGRRVGLDLAAVTLADREAVKLLAVRASGGVALESCPAFLREWIRRETAEGSRLRPAVLPGSPEPRAIKDRA